MRYALMLQPTRMQIIIQHW